jgi:hypothetical protein
MALQSAGILQTLFFLFLNPLMLTGSKKTLEMQDIDELPDYDTANALNLQFERAVRLLALQKKTSWTAMYRNSTRGRRIAISNREDSLEDGIERDFSYIKGPMDLFKVLLTAFGMQRIVWNIGLMLVWIALQIFQPFILQELVLFFYDDTDEWSLGIFWAFALALDSILSSLILNHRFYQVRDNFWRI